MAYGLQDYGEECLSPDYQDEWGIPKPAPFLRDRREEVEEITGNSSLIISWLGTDFDESESESETGFVSADEQYQRFLAAGDDALELEEEEYERELDLAFDEATRAADTAWEKDWPTTEGIEAAVRQFRDRHPYRHD